MAAQTNYDGFNRFQTDFFSSRQRFESYSNYEVRLYAYQLLNNISKGFPNLTNIVINLKGIGWSGIQSVELLRALQSRFVNEFTSGNLPRFVFFKNNKPRATKDDKAKIEIEDSLKLEICNIMMIDSKTFDYLYAHNSERLLEVRKQIEGDVLDKKKGSHKLRTKKIKS